VYVRGVTDALAQEVLTDRSFERYTRTMLPSHAIPEKTKVADALHFWVEGFSNLVLKSDEGHYRFVSQTDLLSALLTGVSVCFARLAEFHSHTRAPTARQHKSAGRRQPQVP
jgi:hypothetical protein